MTELLQAEERPQVPGPLETQAGPGPREWPRTVLALALLAGIAIVIVVGVIAKSAGAAGGCGGG